MEDKDQYNFNIEELFKDDPTEEVDNQDDQNTQEDTTVENKEMTKAVSDRINIVRKKTEMETEERVAKEFGYESYSAMLKAKESKLLKDAGLDEEETSSIVNKLVEQRLANDPRLKKLAEIENREKKDFVTSQLKEISKMSGTNFTSIDQFDKDVLNLWEKTGNLKQAYLAVKGEELLAKKTAKNTGSLDHLAGTSNGNGSSLKTRALTAEEKEIYRSVLGDRYNEEEISKITRPID